MKKKIAALTSAFRPLPQAFEITFDAVSASNAYRDSALNGSFKNDVVRETMGVMSELAVLNGARRSTAWATHSNGKCYQLAKQIHGRDRTWQMCNERLAQTNTPAAQCPYEGVDTLAFDDVPSRHQQPALAAA